MTIKGFIKHKIYQILGPDYWAMENTSQSKTLPIVYNCHSHGIKYVGNQQIDMSNIESKYEQVEDGKEFESSGMIMLNRAIGNRFLAPFSTIVNVGCGIGTFENCHAQNFPSKKFYSIDYDKESIDWCKDNRSFSNVEYRNSTMSDLIAESRTFDIALSIDVIEHLADYKSFLDEISQLSNVAIISTPNRDSHDNWDDIVRPWYKYHVQEFNPGEMFFILKMYYKTVDMYTLNYQNGELEEIGLYTKQSNIIAYCRK